ncbi:ankyrin repeat protein [Colletotrichum tofieldiae]|nr:ankyrin repeat protein [Colletotrichum tofieldiae]
MAPSRPDLSPVEERKRFVDPMAPWYSRFRQKQAYIAASIARQLSAPVAGGPLLDDAVRAYQQREENGFASGPLRLEESKDLIIKLLDRYKDATATIVIDALDECAEASRGRLLELLEDLLETSPCLLKIFVSSRDDQDIVYKLDNYPNLHLSSDRNTTDINHFVQVETVHLISKGELLRSSLNKAELRDKIVDKLTCNAHGMFRWASLQLQELCRQRTDEAILERLGRLPRTLEDLYREILSRIESFEAETDRRLTRSALSWLLCSQRQLKSEHFLAAVCLPKDGLVYKISKAQLLQLCCNLVIFDSAQDAFRFSHLSVREFLEYRAAYQPVPINALVAEACLSNVGSVFEDPQQNALQEYCDLFWAEHAQAGLQKDQTMLGRTLFQFLSGKGGASSRLCDWQNRVKSLIQHSLTRTIPMPMPINLVFKLQDAVERIPSVLLILCAFDLAGVLDTGEWTRLSTKDPGAIGNFHHEVNARHGEGRILEWYLRSNIPFATDEKFLMSVTRNRFRGHKIMALLFDKRGEEVQITKDVVEAAAGSGSRETMALLLDKRGDEVQITEDIIKAAAANWRSGQEIMELLLDKRGDEVQITEDVVKAAAANLNHGQEIMALLLDKRGDEVQITEVVVKAAAANWRSGRQIMALLLDKRGDEV